MGKKPFQHILFGCFAFVVGLCLMRHDGLGFLFGVIFATFGLAWAFLQSALLVARMVGGSQSADQTQAQQRTKADETDKG